MPTKALRTTHTRPAKKAVSSLSFPDALARAPLPATTREKILFAAMAVLHSEGFGALTQTHVAKAAGVRQSHVTYYFPSRNDLLREIAVYGCNTMLAALSAGIEAGEMNLAKFRQAMTADIHDRRFARLMCALLVASDEDERIKPWLAEFEAANLARLQQNFEKLGLPATLDEVGCFHATMVGASVIDLGESTAASLLRAQRKIAMAFDALVFAVQQRSNAAATPRKGKRK